MRNGWKDYSTGLERERSIEVIEMGRGMQRRGRERMKGKTTREWTGNETMKKRRY